MHLQEHRISTKICVKCGRFFDQRFKSMTDICPSCYSTIKWRIKSTIRKCPVCSKNFNPHHKTNITCSHKCAGIYKRTRVMVQCKICHKNISCSVFRVKNTRDCFCSRKCYGRARSQSMMKSNNFRWKNGASYEKYCELWVDWYKELVRSRDKYTCQVCYITQFSPKLVVHHIDYCKKHTNLNNLISVCKKCHGHIHANESIWYLLMRLKMIYINSEVKLLPLIRLEKETVLS